MNIVEKMRKAGYPKKIIGNGGFPATLVNCQPLLDGDFMGIYRYPGGAWKRSKNVFRLWKNRREEHYVVCS